LRLRERRYRGLTAKSLVCYEIVCVWCCFFCALVSRAAHLCVMPCLSVETLILFDDLTVRKRAYAALDYLKRGHRAKNSSLSLSLFVSHGFNLFALFSRSTARAKRTSYEHF